MFITILSFVLSSIIDETTKGKVEFLCSNWRENIYLIESSSGTIEGERFDPRECL